MRKALLLLVPLVLVACGGGAASSSSTPKKISTNMLVNKDWVEVVDPSNGRTFHCLDGYYSAWCYEVTTK